MRSPGISFVSLPVSTLVIFVRANVPSAGLVGVDSHDLGSVLRGAVDVQVLAVGNILDSPPVAAPSVSNLPLREEIRTDVRGGQGGNQPSHSHCLPFFSPSR